MRKIPPIKSIACNTVLLAGDDLIDCLCTSYQQPVGLIAWHVIYDYFQKGLNLIFYSYHNNC